MGGWAFRVLTQCRYEVAPEAQVMDDGRVIDIDPSEVALVDIVNDNPTNHRVVIEPAFNAELTRGAARANRHRDHSANMPLDFIAIRDRLAVRRDEEVCGAEGFDVRRPDNRAAQIAHGHAGAGGAGNEPAQRYRF